MSAVMSLPVERHLQASAAAPRLPHSSSPLHTEDLLEHSVNQEEVGCLPGNAER